MDRRLVSLDQFRGYTVAGMFVVNWLGGFLITPEILKHHRTWCSYADTIMPQFFFAAGFALRLVWLRMAENSRREAYLRLLRRSLGLFVFGPIFHQSGDVWRTWQELKGAGWSGFFSLDVWGPAFQTLVHIAVTSLWLLPVIGRSARVRVVFAGVSAGLHLWISSAFWFDLVAVKRVTDGGPPGFLTWSLPAVAGTLVYDALSGGWKMPRLAVWGCLCMMAGYALSCLSNGGGWAAPPFTSNPNPQDMWTMSQRAGSASYQLFAAGFSIALYSVFRVLCDFRGWRLGLFNDLGSNALAAYLLHNLVMDALLKFAPKDSPAWWALSAGVLHFLLVWWMVRWLNAKKLYLRL